MKTKCLHTAVAFLLITCAFGQGSAFELTFTAIDSATYIQLDSIKVMNLTQESDTTLYWPDTTLVLDYPVGIVEANKNNSNLQLFQNYPNPVIEFTTISLRIPEEDVVNLRITDALGREIINNSRILQDGKHRFRFHTGNGKVYFFTAQYRGESSSIKILRANTHLSGECSLEYLGGGETSPYRKQTVDNKSFIFNLGDELLLIGYHDTLQSGMLTTPVTSEAFTFQFAINIPGLPGGYRYSNGQFQYLRRHALWWSSTEGNSTSAWNRYLSFNNHKVDRDFGDNKGFAFSIRCIRDN